MEASIIIYRPISKNERLLLPVISFISSASSLKIQALTNSIPDVVGRLTSKRAASFNGRRRVLRVMSGSQSAHFRFLRFIPNVIQDRSFTIHHLSSGGDRISNRVGLDFFYAQMIYFILFKI